MKRPIRIPFLCTRWGLALTVIGGLALLFFFPLLQGRTFSSVLYQQEHIYPWQAADSNTDYTFDIYIQRDQAEYVHPAQALLNRSLQGGEFPLWNPYNLAGQPFLQEALFYPLRLLPALVLALPRVHDFYQVFHLILAGVTMFALLSSVLGGLVGPLFGAAAWMLGSFMIFEGAAGWDTAVLAWLPLALHLTRRLARAPAGALRARLAAGLGLGAALGMMVLAGSPGMTALALLAWAGFGLFCAGAAAPGRQLRFGLEIGLGLLLGLSLSAVQWLPLWIRFNSSGRVPLSLADFAAGLLPLGRVGELFLAAAPSTLQPPLAVMAWPVWLLGLAGLVIVAAPQFRPAAVPIGPLLRFVPWLGLAGLLLGLDTPFIRVLFPVLPFLGYWVQPGGALLLTSLALAVLAAAGLDGIGQAVRRRLAGGDGTSGERTAGRARHMADGLLLSAALIPLAWQMYGVQQVYNPHQPVNFDSFYPLMDLDRWMRGEWMQKDPTRRMLPVENVYSGLTIVHAGEGFQVQSLGGRDPLPTTRAEDLFGRLASQPGRRAGGLQPHYRLDSLPFNLLPRLGVTHVLTPPFPGDLPVRVAQQYQTAVAWIFNERDASVFEVLGALPRAYWVSRCEPAASPEAALQRYLAPDFNYSAAVVLEQGCGGPAPAGRFVKAEVSRYELNLVEIRLQAPGPGWLVLLDSWDEGWKAVVSTPKGGTRAAEVLPANGAFRAVAVAAGQSVVEMRYIPPGLQAGLMLTGAAAALGVILAAGLLATRRPG